jgi:YD repeat-containing protein
VQLKQGATVLRTTGYAWDNADQITSQTVNGVTTNYNYDLVGQLTSEMRAGFSAQYAYDANGNRLSKTVNGVSESYSYDSADKLLTVSGGNDPRTFSYDAAGRMTSVQRAAGTTFLAYDFDDRVVQIQDPTGVQNHTYDSLDARISSTFGGVTRNYRRSGAGSWAPVVSDGAALFSPGVAERRGGTTTYLHADSGFTDLQTTAAGAALAGREFSAFGELVQSAGTWQGQSGFMGLENFGGHFKVGNGGGVYDPGTGRVGTPGAGGRNDYTPGSGGPSNRIHPTIEFVPADEGGHYTAPWEWEDFFAGWGDTLTMGGTRQVRVWIGCDDVVDYGSGSYRVGENVGEVHDQAMGGKGKAAKIGARAAEEGVEAARRLKPGSAGGPGAGLPFTRKTNREAIKENAPNGGPCICIYWLKATDKPHVDHIIPRARGGNNTLANAQVTCAYCNLSKGIEDAPKKPPRQYDGRWPGAHWGRSNE